MHGHLDGGNQGHMSHIQQLCIWTGLISWYASFHGAVWASKNHLDSYFWFSIQLLGRHYFTPCGGGTGCPRWRETATSACLEPSRWEEASYPVSETPTEILGSLCLSETHSFREQCILSECQITGLEILILSKLVVTV